MLQKHTFLPIQISQFMRKMVTPPNSNLILSLSPNCASSKASYTADESARRVHMWVSGSFNISTDVARPLWPANCGAIISARTSSRTLLSTRLTSRLCGGATRRASCTSSCASLNILFRKAITITTYNAVTVQYQIKDINAVIPTNLPQSHRAELSCALIMLPAQSNTGWIRNPAAFNVAKARYQLKHCINIILWSFITLLLRTSWISDVRHTQNWNTSVLPSKLNHTKHLRRKNML